MPVIPSKFNERVAFFSDRISLWTTNSSALGLVSGDVTALGTKASAAAAALEAARQARADAKSATLAAKEAVLAMTLDGAEMIKKIKVKAGESGNSVYTLANIPAPATPSPKGPPGTPSDFKVRLNPNGALELRWKCSNPPGSVGTFYYVYRKFSMEAEFDFIGAAGQRDFVDATVPRGTATIIYQIQAARTSAVGVANEFVVNLGVSSAGATTLAVTEGPTSPKLAA